MLLPAVRGRAGISDVVIPFPDRQSADFVGDPAELVARDETHDRDDDRTHGLDVPHDPLVITRRIPGDVP